MDAHLWVGIWEADDFNADISKGPSYGRLAYFNSSSVKGIAGGAWVDPTRVKGEHPTLLLTASPTVARTDASTDVEWVHLEVGFTTGPWPAYADVRPVVLGPVVGESALLDDWTFARA